MPNRPLVVAFDVLETLFSLSALESRFEEVGLPPQRVALWIARTLRDGFALELTGRFEPFEAAAKASLRVLLEEHGLRNAEAKAKEVFAGFSELEAHADVAPAVRSLRAGGLRLIALTNSAEAATSSLLERAGVRSDFEAVVSIDQARHWKPAREVYRHAARAAAAEPEQIALVAAHAWDIQGAKAAGLTTAWVARREGEYHPLMDRPDVRGADLEQIAARLLALPGRRARRAPRRAGVR